MAKAYTNIIENPAEMPEWLTDCLTILLLKTVETKSQKKKKTTDLSHACLSTMYKVLTSILADRTYTFLSAHQLLPSEQKGCKRESNGCKDELLANKMILEDCRTRKKTCLQTGLTTRRLLTVYHIPGSRSA